MNRDGDVLQAIEETARQILTASGNSDSSGSEVFDRHVWEELESSGLTRISIPESAGGSGGNLYEASAVLRVASRTATAIPLAETLLAGWLAASTGLVLPPGPATVMVRDERSGLGSSSSPVFEWARHAPWGRVASTVVILDIAEDSAQVGLLAAEHLHILTTESNLAGEPRDLLRAVASKSPYERREVHVRTAADLLLRAALVRSVQIAGAAEGALDLTSKYLQEREQFGRPLIKFQALQQQLAQLAGEVITCVAAAEAAVAASAETDGDNLIAELPAAAAKCRTSSAVASIARIAHQLHGAIGVTQEYDLGQFTQRLWSWRDEAGDEQFWAKLIGRHLVQSGKGSAHFWHTATDPSAPQSSRLADLIASRSGLSL